MLQRTGVKPCTVKCIFQMKDYIVTLCVVTTNTNNINLNRHRKIFPDLVDEKSSSCLFKVRP